MITPELLQKIRRIQLRTRRRASAQISGQYRSAFKGHGIEFEELREYVPGDDVRRIDWRVTARMSRPFIRRYTEERQLTVWILVDVSRSMDASTTQATRREYAAEIAAILASAASHSNDNVGLMLFSDRAEALIPPRKGASHVWNIIRTLLTHPASPSSTSIRSAAETLTAFHRRPSVVFLLSDFHDPTLDARALRLLGRRHDVVPIWIIDPWEIEVPKAGFIEVEDPETGQTVEFDLASPRVRTTLNRRMEERRSHLDQMFRRARIPYGQVRTDRDYMPTLEHLLSSLDRKG